MRNFLVAFFMLLSSNSLQANELCPSPMIPVTKPKPVHLEKVINRLKKVKTPAGKVVYRVDEELKEELLNLFGGGRVTTKMEQFFATLFVLQNHSDLPKYVMHEMNIEEIRPLLVETGVTPDLEFPKRIQSIKFRRSSLTPKYEITFDQAEVALPLNGGNGFRTWQHGKCQEATHIVFKSPFSFYIKVKDNGNVMAYKFSNSDIKGSMGTRGLFDIDLNYVSLIHVEFIKNTRLGYVKARVAKKEFEVNRHSWILRVITSFFADTTKQAIDW